jgi:hypothetical protein
VTSNREIEKLFDRWNPNRIKAGDRVTVSIGQKYQARVVGLDLDLKNKKVYANLKLLDNTRKSPTRVDVADCYPSRLIFVGHHTGG